MRQTLPRMRQNHIVGNPGIYLRCPLTAAGSKHIVGRQNAIACPTKPYSYQSKFTFQTYAPPAFNALSLNTIRTTH